MYACTYVYIYIHIHERARQTCCLRFSRTCFPDAIPASLWKNIEFESWPQWAFEAAHFPRASCQPQENKEKTAKAARNKKKPKTNDCRTMPIASACRRASVGFWLGSINQAVVEALGLQLGHPLRAAGYKSKFRYVLFAAVSKKPLVVLRGGGTGACCEPRLEPQST